MGCATTSRNGHGTLGSSSQSWNFQRGGKLRRIKKPEVCARFGKQKFAVLNVSQPGCKRTWRSSVFTNRRLNEARLNICPSLKEGGSWLCLLGRLDGQRPLVVTSKKSSRKWKLRCVPSQALQPVWSDSGAARKTHNFGGRSARPEIPGPKAQTQDKHRMKRLGSKVSASNKSSIPKHHTTYPTPDDPQSDYCILGHELPGLPRVLTPPRVNATTRSQSKDSRYRRYGPPHPAVPCPHH